MPDLIAAADGALVAACPCLQARRSPALLRARDLVAAGAIGRVFSARMYSAPVAFRSRTSKADLSWKFRPTLRRISNSMAAAFHDIRRHRGAGIRLVYASRNAFVEGLKDVVVLELGFDDLAPNQPRDISSRAYDDAAGRVERLDTRPAIPHRSFMRRRPKVARRP